MQRWRELEYKQKVSHLFRPESLLITKKTENTKKTTTALGLSRNELETNKQSTQHKETTNRHKLRD